MSKSLILRDIIAKIKPIIYAVMAVSFFINLLILPMSIYSLQVLDRVMSTGSIATLVWLTVIMLAMFAVAGLLQTLRSMILTGLADSIHARIADIALPRVLAQAASGGRGAQHMRDAGTIKQFIAGNALVALLDAPWSVLYILGLFIIHSALGWLTVAGALMLIALAWLNEVLMHRMTMNASAVQMRGLQELELATRNAEVTEAMGMGHVLASRWKKMQQEATVMQSGATARSSVVQGITKFIRLALQVLVTCIAAYLAVHGSVTVGAIIAASILASRALAPFELAISSWKSCTEAWASYGRLAVIFNDHNTDDAMALPAPQGALSVEQVSYSVTGVERPILRNVSFSLSAGDLLGIIGHSGSGKSTLARLILGVNPITAGIVRLDSADISRWPKQHLGQYIGYLPQDVELFGGSIRDNISRFSAESTPEEIVAAAKLAGAHELILRLPQGYDTDIGSSGTRLSAGQRQRIGLARALYGTPKLLVLDEPDASLDEAGLQALLFALNEAKKRGITTLLITHRTSLLAHVDKLLLLREGSVEAFGPSAKVVAALNARQQPQRTQDTPVL